MKLLNEKGKLNKNALLTYLILGLFPILFGFAQNLKFLIQTNFGYLDVLYPFILVNAWGIIYAVFLGQVVRKTGKWKKEKYDNRE